MNDHRRPTASNVTDPELDEMYARLDTAAALAETGYSDLATRMAIIRRLCAGEITTQQARDEDRGE